jgi:hypothetical protein
VVGAERALARGKVVAEPGVLELEPRHGLVVAGQERQLHRGVVRQPVQQLAHAGRDRIAQVARAAV